MKVVIDIPEDRYADIQRIASVQLERRWPTPEQIIAKGVTIIEPQKWIPCSERMPEPRIDVWCNSDLGQTVGYYDETCDMWFKNDYTELIVTAWMPLPEPYKGEIE